MRSLLLILISLLAPVLSATIDLDPEDGLDEEDFEDYFHQEEALSDAEKLRREEALVENERIVKETNERFLAGEIDWYDRVNEESDLPPEDFVSEMTGAKVPGGGRGLLDPLPVCLYLRLPNSLQNKTFSGTKGGPEV